MCSYSAVQTFFAIKCRTGIWLLYPFVKTLLNEVHKQRHPTASLCTTMLPCTESDPSPGELFTRDILPTVPLVVE